VVAQIDREYRQVVGLGATWRRLASYALFEGRPATTRGQWFNPVVRANLRVGERLGRATVDRPVFVLGVGRSGTTHLGKLLSAHPEAAWLNEPKLLWSGLLADEDVSGFYQPHGRFALGAEDATDEVRARAHKVLSFYLRSVGASRVVDKYPEMTYRVPFLRALFPDAVLIAIVRRPEDFVNSVGDWNEAHGDHVEDWWGVRGQKWRLMQEQLVPLSSAVVQAHALAGDRPLHAREMAATEWALGMEALAAARSELDAVVRYEDLAREPVAVMRDLMSVAELPESPRVLELARVSTDGRLRDAPADFGVLAEAVQGARDAFNV
jgi:hypothetical protein